MAEINSIFAKRKAKKGAKKFGVTLNSLDDQVSIPREEERKVKVIHEQILGDDAAAADGGWVDDIEKKKVVVHTGGKQVSEFLNLEDLKTVDDIVAERVYMEDMKKDFTDARIAAARKEEDHAAQKASQPPKEAKPEVAAFIPWRARAQHKEEQQRRNVLDSEDTEAFPTLGNSSSKPSSQVPIATVWGKQSSITVTSAAAVTEENMSELVEIKPTEKVASKLLEQDLMASSRNDSKSTSILVANELTLKKEDSKSEVSSSDYAILSEKSTKNDLDSTSILVAAEATLEKKESTMEATEEVEELSAMELMAKLKKKKKKKPVSAEKAS